jgi:hypothetical protein
MTPLEAQAARRSAEAEAARLRAVLEKLKSSKKSEQQKKLS